MNTQRKKLTGLVVGVLLVAFLTLLLVKLFPHETLELGSNTKGRFEDMPNNQVTSNNCIKKDNMEDKNIIINKDTSGNNSVNWVDIEGLPGFSDFDLEILSSIATPYDETVKDANVLMSQGKYKEAIKVLSNYINLTAFKTHTTYINRLLTQAKASLIWESLPEYEIEQIEKELLEINSTSDKVKFLEEKIKPDSDFQGSLAAAHCLNQLGGEEAIKKLLELRASHGELSYNKKIKYTNNNFSQAVDFLFMGKTQHNELLIDLYRNTENFGSPENSWRDITLASWISFTQSQKARKVLLEIANNEKEEFQKRYHALWATGRMYGDGPANDLSDFLEEGQKKGLNQNVLEAAAVALGYTGSNVVLETTMELAPNISSKKLRKKMLISALKTFHIREKDYISSSDIDLNEIKNFFTKYSNDMRGK